jgi:hypothetical protein
MALGKGFEKQVYCRYLAKMVGVVACESWRTFFINPEGKTIDPPAITMALVIQVPITSPLVK